MNVIFLDFDGVINTLNEVLNPKEDKDAVERRIKILGDICKLYDCNIVIESSYKDHIDDETLKPDLDWIQEYFDLFEKYNIKCIGKVPNIKKIITHGSYETTVNIWKEDEILLYLERHPEIEHFCVIDDDDRVSFPDKEKGNFRNSDLNKLRDYLISPLIYSDTNPNIVGLQESHIEEVGKILEKENIFRNYKTKN